MGVTTTSTLLKLTSAEGRLSAARMSAYLCDPHLHDTFTLGLMRKGTTRFSIRDRKYEATAGDIFLVHPFEVHAGGNGECPIEYDVLYPSRELIADAVESRTGRSNHPMFANIVFKRSAATDAVFAALDSERAKPSNQRSNVSLEHALKSLLIPAFDARVGSRLPPGCVASVEAACEMIQAAAHGPLEIADLHDRIGYSRYHFVRVFHQVTGLTPSGYLRQVRLSHARARILQGEDLAGVAAEAGFSDQAHMTREFRRSYGYTPGQLSRGVRQVAA